MTEDRLDNAAILASAGFGKTYQLAHRYVSLLARGVTPDQISAVTFSRKAAGEIFDNIVDRIRSAASSPETALQTARGIGAPKLKQADFLQMLKDFTRDLNRNHIGTLDSFTISVIRAFPLELGIRPDLQLMDNGSSAASLVRHMVLSAIFNSYKIPAATIASFHEAFKRATFGRQDKRPLETLDEMIVKYWEKYQLLPDPTLWGAESVIWPNGCDWLRDIERPTRAAADELLALVSSRDFGHASVKKGILASIELIADHRSTSVLTRKCQSNAVINSLLDVPDLLDATTLAIEYYHKPVDFKERETALWQVLLRNVIGTEIRKSLEASSGIAGILSHYAELYDPVLRSGRMTFADAQHLLTEANEQSSGSLVSRREDARLYIDYRLDCALDHWLLDEFQDTSNLQWNVIRNLIDEIMQDDSGRRSFFYVGDVKQAVHGWRGGNASLFGQIQRRYGIPEHKLTKSYRSCQAVLDTVNQVFESLPDSLTNGVIDAWKPIWVHHEADIASVPASGHTALLTANATGEDDKCLPSDRYAAVASILKEIDPIRRNLSVGVLVGSNAAGKELVTQLREDCGDAIPICHEGLAQIVDNPVVAALLALIKFADHPGDMFAWRHVQMCPPLATYLAENKLGRSSLPLHLLTEIHDGGFESLVRSWGKHMQLADSDKFGRKRIDDLAAAAAVFDETGSRNCSEFLSYIDGHQVEESGTSRTVKVMTVHKSKGLTFDVVILPQLERSDTGKIDLVMPRASDDGSPLWALDFPVKFVARRDSVLADVRTRMSDAEDFEQLCVLYVGMTRARCATYAVINRKSAATSQAALLREQLLMEDPPPPLVLDGVAFDCLHENGQRAWYEGVHLKPKAVATELPALPSGYRNQPSTRQKLPRVEPSKQPLSLDSAARLFDEESGDIMVFGLAIHELLEQVRWIEDADIDKIVDNWQPTSVSDAAMTKQVIDQFRKCAEADSVRECLARPEGHVTLWREKRFEVIMGNELISGAFDRVTIRGDDDGMPLDAVILDYKSIRKADEVTVQDRKVKDYTPQMTTYRKALAKILGLAEDKITLQLLFTRQQVVREV